MRFIKTIPFLLGIASQCFAQPSESIDVPYVDMDVVIDGELTDPIWNHARTVDLNLINYPANNIKSPVKTTAKIVDTGHSILISFNAQDPEPKNITAALAKRDSRWSDDLVGIKIDTANSRRLNYSFFANPYGVQHDGINNEITGSTNNSWDGLWQSAGKVTDTGYQVEIEIPFAVLNFENSNTAKEWAFELIRIYPRDQHSRISHVPLDRDDFCWLCQYPTMNGFKNAKPSNQLSITPSLVGIYNKERDVYDRDPNWQSDDDVEGSLDIRWGITSNILLNATINPDFSTVEADSPQLKVNQNYSLYYREKRRFFLENSEYFTTDLDLVYTRNIIDPDHGMKLTGAEGDHTFGVFGVLDSQTSILLPGNISSSLQTLNEDNSTYVGKYRYDVNEDLTFGLLTTQRNSDSYNNGVYSFDTRYQLDPSNSIQLQYAWSEFELSVLDQVFDEQDETYKLGFTHESENWLVSAFRKSIGEEFHADLGFMPQSDLQQNNVLVENYLWGSDTDIFNKTTLIAQWYEDKSIDGRLLEETIDLSIWLDGPLLSFIHFGGYQSEKIGLPNQYSLSIKEHDADLFDESVLYLNSGFQAFNNLWVDMSVSGGEKIDYSNNRLGDLYQYSAGIQANTGKHLTLSAYYSYSKMKHKGEMVYTEAFVDFRASYQFNIQSYLDLTIVHTDMEFNDANNNWIYSEEDKQVLLKAVYAYKLDLNTVFYLGYSSAGVENDFVNGYKETEHTYFTKLSYSWSI